MTIILEKNQWYLCIFESYLSFEMEDFVTIATFAYPTELAVIQGRIESEGTKCYVKDEYTPTSRSVRYDQHS
jgi:hypothetical protein